METPPALVPQMLYRHCDMEQFGFETTADLTDLAGIVGQDRAMEALRFGVGMPHDGYNLYALGSPGLGKHTFIRDFLAKRAEGEPNPGDWCYVNNFEQPHKPLALSLPQGKGKELRRDMEHLVDDLKSAIPAAFESDEYRKRLEDANAEFKDRQEKALKELGGDAETQGIALLQTPNGFAFGPTRDGTVISPADYETLPDKEKERVEAVVADFQERLQKIIHQIPHWRRERREKIRQLNQEYSLSAVGHPIDALKEKYAPWPKVVAYLDAVRKDVVDHVDEFRKSEDGSMSPLGMGSGDAFRRFQVNVLIDRDEEPGAPVVYEAHPMVGNLLGRVEFMSQLGALVTDFTLIKPGALHCANNGYLLLDAYKILTQPFAWEGLKRALKSKQIRIESLGQMLSLVSTVALEPEPIPLDVKVIVFGERLLYYLLCEYDPDFIELFKVAADFEEEIDRSDETQQLYARLIATLARKAQLLPFDRGAVARIIEHSSRLADDGEKLSTRMSGVADLLREAEFWAREGCLAVVGRAEVQRAIDEQIHRSDRLRQHIQEEILRGTLMIDTQGERVGQVNGLSVIDMGTYAFGQPTRITATTRLGEGEVVDIEREVDLGGPIHSKGVLILAAFLAQRYARNHQLSLNASLVFEQSYGEVEGDSASTAELCALLSSLANVPIKQCLAVTGSVNQFGQIQPIGGVNEKIEGFFDICFARGLSGEQGVLIPSANIKHLMLRRDVVEAAEQGLFHVYGIDTVDQALTLLTGQEAGAIDEFGDVPEGTVNFRVAECLADFSKKRHAHPPEEKSRRFKRRRDDSH
ncbi:MAG: AAA family ATPase [Sulfuricellaceae bacterium]|nr:AAA family ATPase [Sulfuricellaceae bacterium]